MVLTLSFQSIILFYSYSSYFATLAIYIKKIYYLKAAQIAHTNSFLNNSLVINNI